MKKIKLLLAVLFLISGIRTFSQSPCENGFAGIYPCENVDLLARMTLSEIGGGLNTNDIWGWVSPVTGREYALVGASNGTAFVDIGNPTDPVYLGILPTHTTSSLWRDIETFGNYVVVGSEAPGHGLQFMDLLQLDLVTEPPVEFAATSNYFGFGNSHTINVDPVSGLCAVYGSNTFDGGPHLVDISDPLNPVIAGGFPDDGYTHDGFILTYHGPDQARQGHVILVLCNADALTIADCTDPADCFMLDTHSYPQTGYVHQGWFSKDYRYFFVNDELDELNFGVGTRTHMFDLQDLSNIVYMGFYEANNPAIDHNLYILDQFMYQSNYRSGIRIFDVSRRADAEIHPIAFFDLYPANDNPVFSGTWSNYPFLPSGVNIATSMYDGFFILKPHLVELSQNAFELCGVNQIAFQIEVTANLQFPLSVAIDNLPTGASYTAPLINGPGSYQVFVGNLLSTTPGFYPAMVRLVTTFGESYDLPLSIQLAGATGNGPELTSPLNGSLVSDSSPSIHFIWEEEAGAQSYMFQLASDAGFSSIIEQQQVLFPEFVYQAMLPIGTYFWRVASTNPCGPGAWSEHFVFTTGPVNVQANEELILGLYPNPVSGLLMIRWPGESGVVRITDIAGRLAGSYMMPSNGSLMVDTSELQAGIYFVRCGIHVARLVKK